jgi:drug/metabolite transporter (DMT)-like permease
LLLIIAGVLIITGLSFKKENNSKIMTGITYGVLTGLFIALYTFNDTVAIKTYAVSPLLLTMATNVFSVVFLLPFVLPQKGELKREIKEHKWSIIAIAFLSPAAYILVLEALKYAPLTVVAPARETSILLGVFMGSRVFNEEDGKRRLIASMLILGGIVALSLS